MCLPFSILVPLKFFMPHWTTNQNKTTNPILSIGYIIPIPTSSDTELTTNKARDMRSTWNFFFLRDHVEILPSTLATKEEERNKRRFSWYLYNTCKDRFNGSSEPMWCGLEIVSYLHLHRCRRLSLYMTIQWYYSAAAPQHLILNVYKI